MKWEIKERIRESESGTIDYIIRPKKESPEVAKHRRIITVFSLLLIGFLRGDFIVYAM